MSSMIGVRRALYGVVGFDPLSLFANGEAGAWYDVSDLSTIYQEDTGETAAAVDSQVGLILDKSQGLVLGTEQITNGTFDTDTGWTKAAGVTIGGGVASFSSASSSSALFQSTSVSANKTYECSVTVSNYSLGGIIPRAFGGVSYDGPTLSSNGTHTFFINVGAAPNGNVGFATSGTTTLDIDNFTVKELPGNHATQTTSSQRPILRQSGSLYYLEFDGVDDYLRSAFTVSQPWDRISGIRQVSWTTAERIFGGVSATAGLLMQNPSTPDLQLFDGLNAADNSNLSVGSDGIVTERHDGANSRLRVNGGTYTTGNSGTTLPGGITIGASLGGGANSEIYWYGTIMVGRALTDAEIANAETWMARKAGVTL